MRNPNIRGRNVNCNGNQYFNTEIMRLKKVINNINSSLAKQCYDNGELSACVDHVTKQGYIEVELTGEELTVTVFHNNNNDSECENICNHIKSNIDLAEIYSQVEELEEQDNWQDDPKYT